MFCCLLIDIEENVKFQLRKLMAHSAITEIRQNQNLGFCDEQLNILKALRSAFPNDRTVISVFLYTRESACLDFVRGTEKNEPYGVQRQYLSVRAKPYSRLEGKEYEDNL